MTYTHIDVELVARALHNHPGDTPFDYYDDAKRALDALAAAGRLRTATQHVESSVEDWDGPIPASMARRVDFSTEPDRETSRD